MSVSGSLSNFSDSEFAGARLASSGTSSLGPGLEDICQPSSGRIAEKKDSIFGRTCQVCGIGSGLEEGFDSVQEQREHFKSDWHRYNLQRQQKHRAPLTLDNFESNILDNDVSSISGSESDSDGADDPQSTDSETKKDSSLVAFRLEDGSEFRIWKCLLYPSTVRPEDVDTESVFHGLKDLKQWCVILAKGGHFAAACFEKCTSKQQTNKEPQFTIKVHKTFHRYVVRAKAGTRQSTKDASGKYAKSAGATLRRYNEAALERDIHELLQSWKTELEACSLIFHSLSAADKKTIFAGSESSLDLRDLRLRGVPFPTRRPTFSEVKRISNLLLATYSLAPSKSLIPDNETGIEKIPLVQQQPRAPEEDILQEEKTKSPDDEHKAIPEQAGATAKSSKKNKSRRRVKTKEQRKHEAVETEDSVQAEAQVPDDDNEVEKAVAAANKEIERIDARRKAKATKPKKEETPEERRRMLREAAEKRMALLTNASKSQSLW